MFTVDEPGGRPFIMDERENPRILTNFGDFCFGYGIFGFSMHGLLNCPACPFMPVVYLKRCMGFI